MRIKNYLSRLLAVVLAVVIGLFGFSGIASADSLTGNYTEDTASVLQNLIEAIDLPNDAPNREDIQTRARTQINDYASRYRRNAKYSGLRSFTTMQTALNSLAGYYTSYGARPLPDKLKTRLKQEFKQVEFSLKKEA